MPNQIEAKAITKSVLMALDEAFYNVKGMFLDKGTSLFETLEHVDAAKASQPISEHSASIAAHIEHMRFYFEVIMRYIRKEENIKVDWNDSWKINEVSESEWEDLKRALRTAYQKLVELLKSTENWDDEDAVAGSYAVVAHCAYHLGAIRTAIKEE